MNALNSGAISPLHSASFDAFAFFKAAVAESEGGEDEEVEEGRSHEAAKDDDGHGAFDFATGCTGAEGERKQAESSDGGGHENRHQAFGSAAHGGFEAPGHAFFVHQVLEMGNHHDRVAGGDAE